MRAPLPAAAVPGAPVAVALGKIDPSAAGPALANINPGWIARGCAQVAGASLGCTEPICTSLLPEPISPPSIARGLLIGAAGSCVAPDSVGEAARGWIIPTYSSGAREILATVAGPRCHVAPRPHHARRTSDVDQLSDVARSSGPSRGHAYAPCRPLK